MLQPTARAPERGGGGVTRGESEQETGRKYNIEERKCFSLGIEVNAGNVLSHTRKKTIRKAMSHLISIKDSRLGLQDRPQMGSKVACPYSTCMILAYIKQVKIMLRVLKGTVKPKIKILSFIVLWNAK